MWKQRLIAILLLAAGTGIGYWTYGTEHGKFGGTKMHYGLDIQGGAALLYEADTSKLKAADIPDAMNSLHDIIERRVNPNGNIEATVAVEEVNTSNGVSHRLNVEIPGVVNIDDAVASIKNAPRLEFATEATNKDAIEKDKKAFYDELQKEGTSTAQSAAASLVQKYPLAMSEEFTKTNLTGADLDHAEVSTNPQDGQITVLLKFNPAGTKKFADITKANTGKQVAIYLDDKIVSAPVVREAILDGTAVISGGFTAQQARDLKGNLNSGAVPVPVKLLSTEQVGATLGKDVLNKGVHAGLIGIAIVALFLIIWYRLPGLLATLAMGVYVALMLGLFKEIPITLTAAGIAAFLLSVGMAVDANILIFERMKEEIRAGHRLEDAVEHGFERAWTSIRDSNVSSLISSAILFWFGTSMIRGFAIALGLGVLVSMFTAVTVSRNLLKAVGARGHNRLVTVLFGSGFTGNSKAK